MGNFKSKYFALKHFDFKEEDIKEALKDLERFKNNFEEILNRKK